MKLKPNVFVIFLKKNYFYFYCHIDFNKGSYISQRQVQTLVIGKWNRLKLSPKLMYSGFLVLTFLILKMSSKYTYPHPQRKHKIPLMLTKLTNINLYILFHFLMASAHIFCLQTILSPSLGQMHLFQDAFSDFLG